MTEDVWSRIDSQKAKLDALVERIQTDEAFRALIESDAELALRESGFDEEVTAILADQYRTLSTSDEDEPELVLFCQTTGCRFEDSSNPCGWTDKTLRSCGLAAFEFAPKLSPGLSPKPKIPIGPRPSPAAGP